MVDVRKIRERLHWRQEDVAEYVGVSRSTIAQWETEGREPSGPARKMLAALVADVEAGKPFERCSRKPRFGPIARHAKTKAKAALEAAE